MTTVAITAHPVRLAPVQVPVLLVPVTTRSHPPRACLARVPHATPKLALLVPVPVDHVRRQVLPVRALRVRPVPPVLVDLVPQLALRVPVEHVQHLA